MRAIWNKIYLWIENTIMTRLVPWDSPGPIWRMIFKIPLLLDRLGLGWSLGGRVLILTTVGRVTGKTRRTPMEYTYDPESDAYQVMAGWGGKTDWYRNARANPQVRVRVGKHDFAAIAEPIPDEEVAQTLMEVTRLNPGALKMFQRWAEEPINGSLENFIRASVNFPSLRLRPIRGNHEKQEKPIY